MTNINYRICNKCGRVHFPLSRMEVELDSHRFGKYINSIEPTEQAMFGYGPLSRTKREFSFTEHVAQSEKCFACGNSYTNFRNVTDLDKINMGQTIQGIIFN